MHPDQLLRTWLTLLTAAALWMVASSAQAATLRGAAEVTGDYVTLGDLFDGLIPEQAATPVAKSPELGREVLLDAAWLSRVAQLYQVDWTPAAGANLLLARASTTLDEGVIRAAVEAAVGAGLPGDRVAIDIDGRGLALTLPGDAPATLAVDDLVLQPDGRFTATVVAPAEGAPLAELRVSGRATSLVSVPVLSRQIVRGTVIGADDIAWIDLPRDRLRPDTVVDAEALIGKTPRRSIADAEPIRLTDLQAPVIVSQGASVVVTLEAGALALTTRGRALEDGAMGDVIRVVNTDSNRTIEATVVGPDAVAVQPGAL